MSTNGRPDENDSIAIEGHIGTSRTRKRQGKGSSVDSRRDFSNGGWFRIHNAFFREGYAKVLGPYGIAVYAFLASCASSKQDEAFPSVATIQLMTGMSRSKVIEAVRELEAWGMIHVQNRFSAKGVTSNLYTFTDPSTWRKEVELKGRRGEPVHKSVHSDMERAEQRPPDRPADLPGRVHREHEVHQADALGVPDTPAPVHHMQEPGMPGGHKQHSGNNMNLEEDEESTSTPAESADDGVGDNGVPSLGKLRELVLESLGLLAPDFVGAAGFVHGLDPDSLDRFGRIMSYFFRNRSSFRKMSNLTGYMIYEFKRGKQSHLWPDLARRDRWYRRLEREIERVSTPLGIYSDIPNVEDE